MLIQAEKAMKDNEWIVFLGWTPHPVMGEMKITYLDGMGDSGFGAATVHTNVRAGYVDRVPERRQVHRQPEVRPVDGKPDHGRDPQGRRRQRRRRPSG